MVTKNKIYFLAASLLFLGSCTAKYAVVKSNREEYKISNDVQVDSTIIKTYMPYKVKVDAEMNTVIGYSDVVLTKSSTVPESVLGNFFADAVFHQAKKMEPAIDFVFPTTKGGLRNDIAKGPINVSNIFELMPFENQLVLFNLKGEDVLKVVNYIAISNGQPVSGLKFNIKEKSPEQIIINGKPFDVTKNYWVLTSDYIASGGDDAVGFATPISRKNIGLLVRDALLREVKQVQAEGKSINAKLDGRITKN
ncbi:5'-nucleotidase C-terminal domain-containing protein [Pedobacter boryungensis]|uniref:5'-nucleotidase C-terminal domain-containing protein n=1 Tax=Pedobacter boryungensis TaxID=869962 RepID=A0ABX2DCN9_9SPHI|nr:5'-nucleotidase [Pedobacter boryungensis]NQX30761.1 5'-nucleotidase C-terminal domain-containing protein [Pedobacter boryungensis]